MPEKETWHKTAGENFNLLFDYRVISCSYESCVLQTCEPVLVKFCENWLTSMTFQASSHIFLHVVVYVLMNPSVFEMITTL